MNGVLTDRRLLTAVAVLVLLRLALLPITPPGFYVDEAAGAAHVEAMLRSGANAHGNSWPLFSESLGGGYTTPVYLYPATAWAAVFGSSEGSLRLLSEVMTFLAVLLLAAGVRLWRGDRFALLTAVVALALPWNWLQGSLAWDPAFVPFLVALSFFSWSVLVHADDPRWRVAAGVVLPLSLVGLAYLYPPCRVTAPVLFVAYYGTLLLMRAVSRGHALGAAVSAVVLAVPLIEFMRTPEARGRSAMLSVFHEGSRWDGISDAIANLGGLLAPSFLFVHGDPNLRHATGEQGMLGLASVLPAAIVGVLVFRVCRRWTRQAPQPFRRGRQPESRTPSDAALALVLGAGVLGGLLGSALTYESQPHSLRATAAWPFIAVLLAFGWKVLLDAPVVIATAGVAAFVACVASYAVDLGRDYPERSKAWFDVEVRERIAHGEPTGDYPDLALKYYRE